VAVVDVVVPQSLVVVGIATYQKDLEVVVPEMPYIAEKAVFAVAVIS
jgi:hypothetical protein